MSGSVKFGFRWTQTFAAIGYAVPLVTGFVSGAPGIPVPDSVMRLIQPIVNATVVSIYPDWKAALLFYGPINAFIYGLVGLLLDGISSR